MAYHPRLSPPLRCVQHALPKVPPASVLVAAPHQPKHPWTHQATNHINYDNAANAGSDTSYACRTLSRYEGSMTSTQTFMVGKYQEVAQKLDGLIPSSMIFIILASTSPMLPGRYLTDPSGRSLLADCQRSNPRKVLNSSKFQSEQCV